MPFGKYTVIIKSVIFNDYYTKKEKIMYQNKFANRYVRKFAAEKEQLLSIKC